MLKFFNTYYAGHMAPSPWKPFCQQHLVVWWTFKKVNLMSSQKQPTIAFDNWKKEDQHQESI